MSFESLAARWKSVPAVAVLDRDYPVAPLAAEVDVLRGGTWRAQRSIGQDGVVGESAVDWTILSLRSPGGDPGRTDPGGAGPVDHADTPYLADAPQLTRVLRDLPTTLLSARLMSLGPGVEVGEHRDAKCGLPWGLVRLHVPIVTNPGATMVIEGREYHWDAGRLWFGDFNRPHYVRNSGTTARIHLVVDCLVTPRLLDLFPVEFQEALSESDVLLNRPARPDAPPPRYRFRLPRRFTEWSEEESATDVESTLAAELVPGADGSLLYLDGKPAFGLVHLGDGEYRLTGWSEERTLVLEPDRVRCRVRLGAAVTETVCPVALA